MANTKKASDSQNKSEEICENLYWIRDRLDWGAMEEVFHIKGIKNSGFNTQEHKALLTKMVCDAFGDFPIISDYFMAVFGLEPGFENTRNLTERRNMLLDRIIESKQKAASKERTRNTADSYARNTIRESDQIKKLAKYIAEIEDLIKYSSDIHDYMMEIGGMLVAAPPKPSYEISMQTRKRRDEQPTYVTAKIATELMHRFVSSGEALELSIVNFDEKVFLSTLDSLKGKGLITGREYYGWRNVISVFRYGTDILEAEKAKINTTNGFDFDWFVRFFDAVANISNEDMQKLWGKVLAGEIKQQSSFSLRTIEILRNMTTKEAETLSDYLNKSSMHMTFDNYGRISETVAYFPFCSIKPTLTVMEKLKNDGISDLDEHGKYIMGNRKVIDRIEFIDSDTERSYDRDIRVLQDSNLVEYAEQEHVICLNVVNLCFVFEDLALIIRQTEPSKYIYLLSYKVPNFRRSAIELWSMIGVEPEYSYFRDRAEAWKSMALSLEEYDLNVSLRKVKHITPFDHIEFEGKDLLSQRPVAGPLV